MANATFFLFFVAHNAAGSQGVNERTKRKKIIRDQETGMSIWNSFQPARKKDRSLGESCPGWNPSGRWSNTFGGAKYLVGTQQTINWEDDSKSGREKKRRRSL